LAVAAPLKPTVFLLPFPFMQAVGVFRTHGFLDFGFSILDFGLAQ
jgi:hypothetical protein